MLLVESQKLVEIYCLILLLLRVLEKYYVGELIDNERPTFPEMGLVECN